MTEIDCTYCHRATLPKEERESTPWPEQLVACEFHKQVIGEIDEARAMEAK